MMLSCTSAPRLASLCRLAILVPQLLRGHDSYRPKLCLGRDLALTFGPATSCCGSLHPAAAALGSQNPDLLRGRVLILFLRSQPRGRRRRQGRAVPVAPARHLRHQRFVPPVQGRQLAPPAPGLGMPGKALLPLGQNHPQAVQFPVLPQQVLPAELTRLNIPNAHNFRNANKH